MLYSVPGLSMVRKYLSDSLAYNILDRRRLQLHFLLVVFEQTGSLLICLALLDAC